MTKLYLSFLLLLGSIFVVFGKDATQTQYAIGSEVVIASIRKVQDTCIFPNDLLFMRRLAFVSSRDGDELKSFWNSAKGRNGIWQTTSDMLTQAQTAPALAPAAANLQAQLGVNIGNLSWPKGDLAVPLNDISAARLYTSQYPIPLAINDQANYWVQHYNPAGSAQQFISASQQMPKCSPPGMDLVFIVDSSGSITAPVYQNVRDFLTTVITSLKAGSGNRVGIVLFSDSARVILSLTYDLEAAYQAAQSLPYDNGNTDIAGGFDVATQMFNTYGRVEVPMVAIMMTDGVPNEDQSDTDSSAATLKSLGVNLFTIGVGPDATPSLADWASTPHCMFYYSLTNFIELASSFPELLNSQICDVTAKIPATEACVNGNVELGQYIFYQIPVDSSAGTTIKLEMLEGAATIYVSESSRLPSAANYDFLATANTAYPGQIYISPAQLQSNTAVYAAVVGLAPDNNFTLCNMLGDTVENYTTVAPPTTNSSCISVDLIFILDRSQSIMPDYYNSNVTEFVLDIANQFAFHDEASPGNPAFARFGVIEFSTTSQVTIPLGNYSRDGFNADVRSKVAYSDEDGTTNIGDAFMAAYYQFQQNSRNRNKVIILVVDDVYSGDIQSAKDAYNRLQTFVTLPIGVAVSGTWGSSGDAYSHLVDLIGRKTTFPSMDTSEAGVLDLMDNTLPCTSLPACSAIIFVEEASEAIGPPSKSQFLRLVLRLVNSIEHTPNQRFGLALFSKTIFKDIEMQQFEDFNKTLSDYIKTESDDDSPNGGSTYLEPILTRLNSVINERLYNSYSVLLMGETERVKDIGRAQPLAKSIAATGANVYVLDHTTKITSTFWNFLTGNAYGHVIDGNGADDELLFATFSQTLMSDFIARGC